jgi:hypothetical protein
VSVLTVNSEGKTLYAICVEKHNRRGQVLPDIIYVHASNDGEARWIFGQDSDYRQFKIIAVAPAVGYFVADNHGDVLIA